MPSMLDRLMESASKALARMDYLGCEALCLEALALARAHRDWAEYARILLPMQEARRHRRMIASEGVIRLGTTDLSADPEAIIDWLAEMPAGCMVLTHPHTADAARALVEAARAGNKSIEVLLAENASTDAKWHLRSFAGPSVGCQVSRPPGEWLDRWLKPAPPGGEKPQKSGQRPADWFIDATEALGDAALAELDGRPAEAAAADPRRLEWLENCLEVVTDHEIIHQRLGQAARGDACALSLTMSDAGPQPERSSTPAQTAARAALTAAAAPPPAEVATPAVTSPAAPTDVSPRRKRLVRILLAAAVLLVLAAAALAYGLWCSVPEYWTRHEQFLREHDATTLQRLADDVERRVLNGISDQQGPEPDSAAHPNQLTLPTARGTTTNHGGLGATPGAAAEEMGVQRKLHFSLDEINAWMAMRLPSWAANKNMPLPVTSSMATVDGGRLILAAQVDSPHLKHVVSVILSVRLQTDGLAVVKIEGLRGGRLPLPKGAVASRLRTDPELSDRPEVQHILAMFDGRLFDPVLALDSRRRLRVIAFQAAPDGIDVTLREEARPGKGHTGTR